MTMATDHQRADHAAAAPFHIGERVTGMTYVPPENRPFEQPRLKQTSANKNEELTRLRGDIPALVRALNQLTAENEELRQQLQLPSPSIVPLRPAAK
ncbi:hypothetical protein ABR737_40960 [Streptomyces sp. Edi2]|uniref:hypothetical protein n=1 Tax=Streptomyces sp. Edi2 TaxID=3162528 RepID=UPI0033062A8D